MTTKKYRMYVDEVGNSDVKSSENHLHRFLSLTGVIVDLKEIKEVIFPQIEKIKSEYFGSHPDDPVIFHRKEILNAQKAFSVLRNSGKRKSFDNELLDLLKNWEYTVVTVCLDKKAHKEKYKTWRYDPYHYCLAILIERFTMFLEQNDSFGDVMAESRGGKEDTRLKKTYSNIHDKGTEYIAPERIQPVLTSKQLKIKPKSKNISGLQLADLLAHPSRNEILNENELLDKPVAKFAKKIIAILETKYYQSEDKIYGKKFL